MDRDVFFCLSLGARIAFRISLLAAVVAAFSGCGAHVDRTAPAAGPRPADGERSAAQFPTASEGNADATRLKESGRQWASAWVDQDRLTRAQDEPNNWFTGGRDQKQTYFSPLKDINTANAGQLGFAWQYDLGTARGQEATPIVVDGKMFFSGNFGRVYALDAVTGSELWTFDPHVDGQVMRAVCCDAVNRGLVLWHGRIFVAALDGRLFALDAATGKVVWVADSTVKNGYPYAVTGAPQVAGGVVVIGSGGADFGSRGYVSAFNVNTGALKWRFFVVPHDPAQGPQESPDLEAALKTWDSNSDWKDGGGGNAWDGIVYDPETNLVFVGTGNAAPWDWRYRSPKGGSNLYLSSIVAIDASTGRLAWFYQTTPRENWDYTAVQKMILADLMIDGKLRKVIMQAPKNGFFYVLDRVLGQLISAKPYIFQNWNR
jgi:quinohemoprotein ethanol dehydrogenase